MNSSRRYIWLISQQPIILIITMDTQTAYARNMSTYMETCMEKTKTSMKAFILAFEAMNYSKSDIRMYIDLIQ